MNSKTAINRWGTAASLLPLALGAATNAQAQPVPGGTLDPLTIPKYVTPLVIPPVLFDDLGGADPIDETVALRQFSQQVLPTQGCDPALYPDDCVPNGDTYAFRKTTLWGYCDGADATNASCNNPSFTVEVTKDTQTTITWKNELVDAQGNYLSHIIRDKDGKPVVDQTLHWAAPNGSFICDGTEVSDCRGTGTGDTVYGYDPSFDASLPYTGPVPMVTHVHGAHVGPVSDGYPEAWWLPAASNIPYGYETSGTFYDTAAPAAAGTAVYKYTNDQPTTTLWYHDHSLGMTRLNVYAAGAGFWLIRAENDGETGLISGVLPGPAPLAGDDPNGDPEARAKIREIPIAIQPKSFNTDGSQYYPADRAFFEGLGNGDTFAQNTHVAIPFMPQGTSDIAPVWNPEAFFNTMVVNGNTWPWLDVAPERYRFRLLNASDSRFLNLSLFVVNADGTLGTELPFYQIGAEQSLLREVVQIETGFATPLAVGEPLPTDPAEKIKGTFKEQALLMGPAERADVIVDFGGLPEGTVVRMLNTGPDAPFGGFPDVPADPDTTGQVMQFVVNPALAHPDGDPSSPPNDLRLDRKNPGGEPRFKGKADAVRELALLEEESGQICVNINPVTGAITQVAGSVPPACALGGVPFAPKAAVLGVDGSLGGTPQLWDDPIAQNPKEGAVEEWELWNWSADAHPIHLHLVKFQVQERQIIGGKARDPEPWESGWKDTVIAYPGEVTRIRAKFDTPGLYVWHCHILSHEDNEMMVPFFVGDAPADFPLEFAP
jgi:FtsP/CotA-like multicopper oxidase with cupredoxin domain